jgi:hypothetical protein
MGVQSTQGRNFQLVAGDNVILDLFKDEEILLSDNVTGLFDLGKLPSDFTRQITLPGTKKNNAFFEHYYDISVFSPDTFATNTKVPAYLDFGGIYLAQGYIQLNKVTLLANKFIDSYEVTIYGALSSFAREVNRSYLTDMTASLAHFNHSASLEAITGSWEGKLFSGSIVYPFAEYGQKILYLPQENLAGIEDPSGSLFVQDYKPAIRVKEVWDAIFEEYGYTYTGDFWNQGWLDQVYMVCNNKLRYPIFSEVELETYGQIKIGPISGSGDIPLSGSNAFTSSFLPWYTIQKNPANNISQDLTYGLEYPSKLRGLVNLNFRVSGSNNSNAAPQFDLVVKDLQGNKVGDAPLNQVNTYLSQLRQANASVGQALKNEKYNILSDFNTPLLPSGSYRFYLEYSQLGNGSTTVFVDPDGELKSSLEITKVGNVGEGMVMNIGANMPYGTNGIKKIDFITGLQKKFNLVIYPSKTKRNEFIVEAFNKWYKEGIQWDFNQFANLDKPIEVIPANNLAVNELQFGDKLDQDYVSQQFSKQENREFGKTYYVDTENFFSQGQFKVESAFASSPIVYLGNTGVSGSRELPVYRVSVRDEFYEFRPTTCTLSVSAQTEVYRTIVTLLDENGNNVTNFGANSITVDVGYTDTLCLPSPGDYPFTQSIVVGFGQSTAFYEYDREKDVDCGGTECFTELRYIDCVLSVTNASLTGSSPISAC